MLPKNIYSKVIQGLKPIKAAWDKDRQENPHLTPYEVTHQVKNLIERCITEGKMKHLGGVIGRQNIVEETIEYLTDRGILMASPYGGEVMFPIDKSTIPTKEQVIQQAHKQMDQLGIKSE